ncbi:MAG: MliC family protein [Candidatus Falkowbacteria bacterium]
MKRKTKIKHYKIYILIFIGGIIIGSGIFCLYSILKNKDTIAQNDSNINYAVFNCVNSKTIQAIFFNGKVELILNDGRNLLLEQAISASGARYANSDESIVFWNKGNTAFIEEAGQVSFSDCSEGNKTDSTLAGLNSQESGNNQIDSSSPILPLYPNLTWNKEVATTTVAFGMYLTGTRINSKQISDSAYYKSTSLFDKYYDNQLTANGWGKNKDYVADGPGTSIWAYTKGSKIIVLSYTSEELNPSTNRPFSCPCQMTFSIFYGEIK